jgi:hypothetical protein
MMIAAIATTSCKDILGKLTGKGDGEGDGTTVDKPGTSAKTTRAQAESGCALPSGGVTASFRVPAGCTVDVERDVAVDKDAVLTIERGARLRFKPGAGLVVRRGGLVAMGTEKEPVVFTSANAVPAKGDWDGIRFENNVAAGTALDRVVIEYAGKAGAYGKGAITFWGDSPPGRVAITNSVLRNNGQRGVENKQAKASFAKFEGNELADNDGTSLLLHPNVIGSIGSSNKIAEPVRVAQGQVNTSATWPKIGQPYVIEGELSIQGAGAASVLTLPEGAVLKFGTGVRLDIGEGAGGGLVAKGVTFTSADPTPAPGAWTGIMVHPKTSSTMVDNATVEYAGRPGGYGKGALTFWGTKPADLSSFEVKNTVFRNNKGAAVWARGGCGALEAPPANNRSEGVPLCVSK